MISSIIAAILNWLGSGVLDRVLTHLERKADNETERKRIKSIKDQHTEDLQASVIKASMSHTIFWVAWSIAVIPMCLWFGYAMLNTIFPFLPHVAEIPPGLLDWAKILWSNVFFSGAGVLSATTLKSAILNRR